MQVLANTKIHETQKKENKLLHIPTRSIIILELANQYGGAIWLKHAQYVAKEEYTETP